VISVIIPTYNRAELLMTRSIPSVYDQTDEDWELLVVGDGTDEETVDLMGQLCAQDDRVHFWNLPHAEYPETGNYWDKWAILGIDAMNWGLDHARGEWVHPMDDDDAVVPEHHAVLLKAAVEHNVDFAYGVSMTFKGDPPQFTGQLYGDYPVRDAAFVPGANIYKASLPYRYDKDCVTRGRTRDSDMWQRMRDGGVSFYFERQVVHHYYRNYP
jgi:glycosyltransferase involved in cell wall biosynthesis